MAVNMEIEKQRPRTQKQWDVEVKEGCGTAQIYCNTVVVRLFTYDGSVEAHRSKPFTTLECYYNGEVFTCRLPRHYHPRWWNRIASNFEWKCIQEVASE